MHDIGGRELCIHGLHERGPHVHRDGFHFCPLRRGETFPEKFLGNLLGAFLDNVRNTLAIRIPENAHIPMTLSEALFIQR